MKPSVIGGGAGAVLGAIVAVQAHFTSRVVAASLTLPRRYADYDVEGSHTFLGLPEVPPSWWPVLPIAIAVGLVVGVLATGLYRRFFSEPRIALFPLAGAVLGAFVGVIAHFIAHTLPDVSYSGMYFQDGSTTVQNLGGSQSVRPSWLWSLPISIVVGLLLGLAAVLLLRRVGARPEPVAA